MVGRGGRPLLCLSTCARNSRRQDTMFFVPASGLGILSTSDIGDVVTAYFEKTWLSAAVVCFMILACRFKFRDF